MLRAKKMVAESGDDPHAPRVGDSAIAGRLSSGTDKERSRRRDREPDVEARTTQRASSLNCHAIAAPPDTPPGENDGHQPTHDETPAQPGRVKSLPRGTGVQGARVIGSLPSQMSRSAQSISMTLVSALLASCQAPCRAGAAEVCIPAGRFTLGAPALPFSEIRYFTVSGEPCVPNPQNACVQDHAPGPRNDFAPGLAVELSSFIIDKTKVTNEAYGLCVTAGACCPPLSFGVDSDFDAPANANRPVVGVTWYKARDYCVWKGSRPPPGFVISRFRTEPAKRSASGALAMSVD